MARAGAALLGDYSLGEEFSSFSATDHDSIWIGDIRGQDVAG